jgi:cell division protein ZapA (FtsZ GTPase activity inhibitor)
MVAIDWTLSIGELATLAGVAALLAIGGLRLGTARAAERRAAAAERNLRALTERVEVLVQASAGPVAFTTTPAEPGCLSDDSEVLDEGLVSRLAVAVSILVQHAELAQAGDKDPGVELLEAVRESCLAMIETVWIKDINNAYDASRRRREALFKRCCSVAELRRRIHQEDAALREDMARLDERIEEMLLATEGRYAKASTRLTAALRRILG